MKVEPSISWGALILGEKSVYIHFKIAPAKFSS